MGSLTCPCVLPTPPLDLRLGLGGEISCVFIAVPLKYVFPGPLIDEWALLNYGTFIGCVQVTELLGEPWPPFGCVLLFQEKIGGLSHQREPRKLSSCTMSGWTPPAPVRPCLPQPCDGDQPICLTAEPPTHISRLEPSLEVAVQSPACPHLFHFSTISHQC